MISSTAANRLINNEQLYVVYSSLLQQPLPITEEDVFHGTETEKQDFLKFEETDLQLKLAVEFLTSECPQSTSPQETETNNNIRRLLVMSRVKNQYLKQCVAKQSKILVSMDQPETSETAKLELAARYYQELESLARKLANLVKNVPDKDMGLGNMFKGQLRHLLELQRIQREDFGDILDLPMGLTRAIRVVDALAFSTEGLFTPEEEFPYH